MRGRWTRSRAVRSGLETSGCWALASGARLVSSGVVGSVMVVLCGRSIVIGNGVFKIPVMVELTGGIDEMDVLICDR